MNERLTTQLLMGVTLKASRLEEADPLFRFSMYASQIDSRMKLFEAMVWFPRLQAIVNGTDSRGMSGTCRTIAVSTWCCAGRCLVQLERGGHRITLITADDEKPWTRAEWHQWPNMGPMGWQSIDGEFAEIMKILYEATRYGDEIAIVPNDSITIG